MQSHLGQCFSQMRDITKWKKYCAKWEPKLLQRKQRTKFIYSYMLPNPKHPARQHGNA